MIPRIIMIIISRIVVHRNDDNCPGPLEDHYHPFAVDF